MGRTYPLATICFLVERRDLTAEPRDFPDATAPHGGVRSRRSDLAQAWPTRRRLCLL